jgi:hypothetical protein
MTQQDSIDFIGFLAGIAQNLTLSIGLKNSGAIISQVLPAVQWEVNEQCVQFSECTTFDPFIDSGKPVFHIEYTDEVQATFLSTLCSDTGPADGAANFSTVLKHMNLDGNVQYCNGANVTTPTT